MSQRVTVYGPNITFKHGCTFEVHAEGCSGIRAQAQRENWGREGWTINIESEQDAVESVYCDIIAENEDATWETYHYDLHFAPCVTVPYKSESEQPISAPYVQPITFEHPVTKQLHDAWVVLDADGQTMRGIFLSEANAQQEFANRVYPRLVQPV